MKSKKPIKKKIHKIVVDRKACISAETCVVVAPKAFQLDEDKIAVVLPNAHEQDDNTIFLAAQSCPTAAIVLYDENDDKIFP